jgi:DNA mismatch repair protein MutL
MYPVGLVRGTYIICQNELGMYLIDQHAAKERVNYEIVEDSFKSKEITVTDCLIPITIELNSSDFLLIKEHIDVLEDMGFKLEEFGINTFKINSHPTWLKEGYEEEVIRNIFDEIIMLGKDFDRVRFNNKVIATIACKMSVRANTRLSQEAMEEIISELVKCRNPYNCAHGRPAIVKFSNYELERMFKRVMN